MNKLNHLLLCSSLVALAACQTEQVNTPLLSQEIKAQISVEVPEPPEDPALRERFEYPDPVAVVYAAVETASVPSLDDAEDDPAIWVHPTDSSRSLVLGTDKKTGIAVYDLEGKQLQFVTVGLPNNIDLRQNLKIGSWQGDLAVASNRQGDVVTLFQVTEQGVSELGSFTSMLKEPYGVCLGVVDEAVTVFVTHKTGEVLAYHIMDIAKEVIDAKQVGLLNFASQLEGCVVDDTEGRLFVGEEETGFWTAAMTYGLQQLDFAAPESIDFINGQSGVVADIEGVSRYQSKKADYLVVSSQGNDSYAVYDTESKLFMGRFRIASKGVIDGAQETDGLDVSAAALGPQFPKGMLVVQDGYNAPVGTAQNFKYVDWRAVENALNLPR